MVKNLNLKELMPSNWSKTLFSLLICTDLVFFIFHFLNKLLPKSNPLLDISVDGSYAEAFQYMKEFWICIALYVMFRHSKQFVYLAWAIFFFYILWDDMLTIHEGLGLFISERFGYYPAFGLRARDFGEVAVFGVAAVLFVTPIAYFYCYSNLETKIISQNIGVIFAGFFFFGVIIDLFHMMFSSVGIPGWTIVEDGGEMLSLSVLATYVVALLGERFRPINRAKLVQTQYVAVKLK